MFLKENSEKPSDKKLRQFFIKLPYIPSLFFETMETAAYDRDFATIAGALNTIKAMIEQFPALRMTGIALMFKLVYTDSPYDRELMECD